MMSVKDELHGLVDRLNDEQALRARDFPSSLVGEHNGLELAAMRVAEWSREMPLVTGRAFRLQPPMDWRTLAARQGVRPVERFEDLLGDFWPEDETADEFIAAVREWRREGGTA